MQTLTTRHPDARSGLYAEPNVRVLDAMTELVDPSKAMVTVHRSGTVHVTAMGESLDQMRANLRSVERTLTCAGYPVITYSATLLYLTKDQCDRLPETPVTRLRPGTMVYDVHGDPEDPADIGTVYSVQPGGYGVIWTGDVTPKFAASDEVALLPKGL